MTTHHQPYKSNNSHGFSLLELMITLVIVGILMAIAYPTYVHHLVKVRRHRARVALKTLATRLEHHYALEGNYNSATSTELKIQALEQGLMYHLALTDLQADHFTISAVPLNSQAKQDSECATLILNDLNQPSVTGPGKPQNC